jgi:hypothetical protein
MGVGCAWSGSISCGVGRVLAGQWLAGRSEEGGFKRDKHPAVAGSGSQCDRRAANVGVPGLPVRRGYGPAGLPVRPYSVAASVAFSAKPVRVMAVGSVPGRR